MKSCVVFSKMAGTYRRDLARGEVLFARGDTPWGMFLLETGRMRLRRIGKDGDEMTIAAIQAGRTFAEASLFSDVYHCDAVADEDSQVLVLPPKIVLAGLKADAEFAQSLVHRLASQLQESRMRSEIRNIRSAGERLVTALRLLAGSDDRVVLQGTLKQFASEIGLTHEAVYRTMASLEMKGRLRRLGPAIQLL